MPRQARTASGTGIYHIMMRGVNRRNIFDDDEDRQRFVQILDGLPFQYDEQGTLLPIRTCSLYAWCLMTNHFHLLIRERDWKISEVIKSLASSYVFYYNKKNERIGHLFQERFKSEPCNDMEYFVTLLRYIHQNRRTKRGQSQTRLSYALQEGGRRLSILSRPVLRIMQQTTSGAVGNKTTCGARMKAGQYATSRQY